MPNCDPNVPDTEEYLLYTDSENFVRKYVEKHNPNYIVAYSEFYDKNINIHEFISEKYQEVYLLLFLYL